MRRRAHAREDDRDLEDEPEPHGFLITRLRINVWSADDLLTLARICTSTPTHGGRRVGGLSPMNHDASSLIASFAEAVEDCRKRAPVGAATTDSLMPHSQDGPPRPVK